MMAIFSIFCCGLMVGGAFATFYSTLGIFSKLLYKCGISKGHKIFSFVMCLGLVYGSIASVFDLSIVGCLDIAYVQMLFGGAFVGIYFALLAEVLKIVPLLSSFGFTRTLVIISIFAVALGKLVGSILYFIFPYFM